MGVFNRLRNVGKFTTYIILLHVSVVRPSSSKNILIARVTQLTTDPLFHNIANILVVIVIGEWKVYTEAITSPITTTIFNAAGYIRRSL
jgi:hypothetical protein